MTLANLNIGQILKNAVSAGASDIHIGADQQPVMRVNGDLVFIDAQALSDKNIETWLKNHLDEELMAKLYDEGDADFAFPLEDGVRFRANAFMTQGQLGLALRILNSKIPTFDDLNLPNIMRSWSERQTGLVIVTGPTGSGKSTTLASLVNAANQSRPLHTVTIEDPIEFILPEGQGTIHQREIGIDASNFPRAVRAALREDVDILVLGEMRDQETISAALTVAETGHLVFATLHTPSATQAIDRIIDAFDAGEQPLIRSRLAASLVGVAYQRLIKSNDGKRTGAFEVLVANYAVKNLIREGKTHQIPNVMTTAMNEGMQTMQHAIKELIKAGTITEAQGKDFLAQNI